jgi:hypothetical protein
VNDQIIPTDAAIDLVRHARVGAIALIARGASEASLEGCQPAGTRDHPSRPAQERGHLRMTVTVWCRWYKSRLGASRVGTRKDVFGNIRTRNHWDMLPGRIPSSASRRGVDRSAGPVLMLLEIITRREVSSAQPNLFDYAKGRPFNGSIAQDPAMFEAISAFLIVLSVGILIAHALDAFRPWT